MITWIGELVRRRAEDAAPPCEGEHVSPRQPRVETEVVVIVHGRESLRAAVVRRTGRHSLVVRSEVSAAGDPREVCGSAILELRECVGRLPRAALVVTPRARPGVLYPMEEPRSSGGASSDARDAESIVRGWVVPRASHAREDLRIVVASMERQERDAWQERLSRCDLRLEGIYPLGGCPVGALDRSASSKATLCLQVEGCLVALAEIFEGGLRAIQVAPAPLGPSLLKECLRLVGPACEELWLCGAGVDLSALGYQIVTRNQTWVRLLHAEDRLGELSTLSILGAARQAFGMAPADALACVPAS